jgi:lysophospholipase L1-like esterase
MRDLAVRNPELEVFDASSLFCDETVCHAARRSQLLYQDGNHLTLAGSRLIATGLASRLPSFDVARTER